METWLYNMLDVLWSQPLWSFLVALGIAFIRWYFKYRCTKKICETQIEIAKINKIKSTTRKKNGDKKNSN
jgi:hypothetical protein